MCSNGLDAWVGYVFALCYALLSGLSLLQSAGRGRLAGCFTFVFLLALFLVLGALCLFITVSWVGLQCVIAVFPVHTYLFFRYTTHDFFSHLPNYRCHYSFTLVMIYFNFRFLVTRTETLCPYTIITQATL